MYEPRISPSHLEHDVRQLFDRMQIRAADVVNFAGTKVVADVCHGSRAVV